MRSLHRCFRLALPAAAAALSAVAGCDFPDATFTDDTSAASGGGAGAGPATSSESTAASSSDAAGSGGGAATSGAGGDGGGSTASGSGGAGGDGAGGGAATSSASASASSSSAGSGGGAATSSASSSSAASGSGGGGSVDCDADDDGYRSTACEGGNDCNDDHPLVHPGQPSTFYDTPIGPGRGFDYDCSGVEEREFRAVNCSGLLTCAVVSNVFLTNVPCGATGPFGSCSLTCQSTITFPNYVRACH
ncbi:hypothetical protein [Sorangium sp. So ce1078]|uniref:hypothetical protein n=1 Tax=Sorangium sp. So ce1078 TaxID=3133329 RepID=UPI003F60B4F5